MAKGEVIAIGSSSPGRGSQDLVFVGAKKRPAAGPAAVNNAEAGPSTKRVKADGEAGEPCHTCGGTGRLTRARKAELEAAEAARNREETPDDDDPPSDDPSDDDINERRDNEVDRWPNINARRAQLQLEPRYRGGIKLCAYDHGNLIFEATGDDLYIVMDEFEEYLAEWDGDERNDPDFPRY